MAQSSPAKCCSEHENVPPYAKHEDTSNLGCFRARHSSGTSDLVRTVLGSACCLGVLVGWKIGLIPIFFVWEASLALGRPARRPNDIMKEKNSVSPPHVPQFSPCTTIQCSASCWWRYRGLPKIDLHKVLASRGMSWHWLYCLWHGCKLLINSDEICREKMRKKISNLYHWILMNCAGFSSTFCCLRISAGSPNIEA